MDGWMVVLGWDKNRDEVWAWNEMRPSRAKTKVP